MDAPRRAALAAFCCAAGAARVLLFCAAFPLFTNVDERFHFDFVEKASRGVWPRGIEPFSPAAARLAILFGSPEYRFAPSSFADGRIPAPLWRADRDAARRFLAEREAAWRSMLDVEGTHPPLYYAVSGAWYRAGLALGLGEGDAVYWARFLDALLYAALIALSFWGLRRAGADDWLCLGVPALLACFPQGAFYGISNDALCPLIGAAVFLAAWRLASEPEASLGMWAATGALLAAAFLTKIVCVTLWVPVAVAARSGARRQPARAGALLAAFALPVALWAAWRHAATGDWLGGAGAVKAAYLGWTLRPLGAWLHHPLLTPAGAARFLWTFTASFWRGELPWHGVPMRQGWSDALYVLSTWAFVGLAAAAAARAPRGSRERTAVTLGLAFFAAQLAFQAWLSFRYDFPASDRTFPTKAEPFIFQGRLALAGLLPFAVLYVQGLSEAARALKLSRALALGAILAAALLAQALVDAPVFASAYNWFHLPAEPAVTRSL